ncbi:MAG: TIGR01777 family oxidoreductase [Verrucomicrobiota bacterium]
MTKPKKIILAGGNGFLGSNLARHLVARGYEVVVLSRRFNTQTEPYRIAFWDGVTKGPWCDELEGAHAVINLSGRSVDCRYNAKNRGHIMESRLFSTRILARAIHDAKAPPAYFVNAASATIYADTRGNTPANDEVNGIIGDGFSVTVCKEWEAEFNRWTLKQTHKVCLRIAITLGNNAGAMVPLKNLARLGLGGPQGPGTQFISWLHIDDFCGIVEAILEGHLKGALYNCASPNPMMNRDFMRALREHAGGIGNHIGIPMPRWLLEIGARMIQTETELILKSRKVVPRKLLEEGYNFKYPELRPALSTFFKKTQDEMIGKQTGFLHSAPAEN